MPPSPVPAPSAPPTPEPRTWVVCDLEATCWRPEGDGAVPPRREAEIIEIGAVRLDHQHLAEQAHFSTRVRPERHPQLSAFCRALTGLDQAAVDQALPFAQVWPAFADWLGEPTRLTFVTWGAFDGAQLQRQVTALGQPAPTWQVLDLKPTFAAWRRLQQPTERPLGLHGALASLDLTFEGTPHQALADARNTARILSHIWDLRHLGAEAQAVLRALARFGEPLGIERLRRLYPRLRLSLGRQLKALALRGLVAHPAPGWVTLTAAGAAALARLADPPPKGPEGTQAPTPRTSA